jgi:energy-coupling factor transporter ATP-binding protein EcfA2
VAKGLYAPESGTLIEVVPRRDFLHEFGRDYVPGQHVSYFGPTGRGKSTLAFQCLERVIDPDMPVISLHGKIKGRDPVIARAAKRCHLRVVPTLPSRARMTVDRKRKWNGYIVAPLEKPTSPDREEALLQAAFKDAISRNYQTTRRHTITHINEAHQTQADLGLKKDVEAPLMRGGPDNAVWNEGQRGAYISYHTYNAPEHLFIFWDPDKNNRKRYADFGTGDPREIEEITSKLKTGRSRDGRTISQALYIRRSGGMYVVDI